MIYRGIKRLKITSLNEKGWMVASSHLIANNIFYSMICALDLLVVEVCSRTEKETGYYAAALTITAILNLVPTSIYQALKPELATLLKTKKKKHLLQKRLNKINLLSFVLLALLSFVLIYFEKELLLFFGPNYLKAGMVVTILTIGYAVGAYTQMSVLLLIMAGYEKLVLDGTILELVTLFIVLIPATYYYGIIGTASATSLAMIIKSSCYVVLAHKKLGLHSSRMI
jgi:O-antigen/teichoic acid export membrane protein